MEAGWHAGACGPNEDEVCTIDMDENGRAIDVLPGGRFFAYRIRFAHGNAVDRLGTCEPLPLDVHRFVECRPVAG